MSYATYFNGLPLYRPWLFQPINAQFLFLLDGFTVHIIQRKERKKENIISSRYLHNAGQRSGLRECLCLSQLSLKGNVIWYDERIIAGLWGRPLTCKVKGILLNIPWMSFFTSLIPPHWHRNVGSALSWWALLFFQSAYWTNCSAYNASTACSPTLLSLSNQ